MTVIDEISPEVEQQPTTQKNHRLIEINQAKLSQMGFISTDAALQRTNINTEFRAIKHEILNKAFGSGATNPLKNLVMLTSAMPNEGKTFCAINLAMMLSLEKDRSVLLVDGDVLRPSVHKILNFENQLGMIDYLSGQIDNIEDAICDTSIRNLQLLPAGAVNSLTYEMLESDRMQKLIERLVENHQDSIIIFDGPPALGVIETISLSRLVGQVIIVAEHNKTKLSDIKKIQAALSHHLFTGLIINKSVNKRIGKYGYGYGYYSYA